ncbi:hypothetical protein HDV03_005075 [Kappamyces sp. JEL0829]|nr:hypothetical protein HDV03_005075 [Kappamyces sp. JEL0829]
MASSAPLESHRIVDKIEEVSEEEEPKTAGTVAAAKLPAIAKTKPSKHTPAPESLRLKHRLVNKYQTDILATVGSYDPYPVSWVTGTTGRVDYSRGKGRFKEPQQTLIGPGFYRNANKPDCASSIGSPFQSTTQRFKAVSDSNQIAPGSYDIYHPHVERGWKPFVETLPSRLGRLLEPSQGKLIGHGPSLQLLEELSVEQPRNVFVATKVILRKDLDSRSSQKDERRNILRQPLATPSSIHPFSAQYLVKK